MTPHRNNQRGTLILDRQFKGVGRIKRASGTSSKKLFKSLDAMLGILKQAGRLDLLQAIKAGTLTPLEVWAKFRLGDMDKLPTAETMRGLKDAMEAWVARAKAGAWHRASRRYSVAALLSLATKDATVEILPALVRQFEVAAKGPAMFNRTRAAALAFIRDTLGRSHRLYGEIRSVQAQTEQRRAGKPRTVEEVAALAEKMGEFGPCLWAMAISGMGPGEYWGPWTARPDRILIHGTKRAGRVRAVPRVADLAPARGTPTAFRLALKAASGGTVTPYDMRRTFATWLEEVGIPRTRRRMYLGHGVKDVTDLYERVDVDRFLVDDGERLRHLVGGKAPALRLKVMA